MMKKLIVTALLCGASLAQAQTAAPSTPSSPAKKELVQKVLTLQQADLEGIARNLVEQPALQMFQDAGRALQQVPADKRDAAGKAIEADIKKYVEDTVPLVRERAVKLAPSTFGAALEERLSEDELKQLVAWLESPVNKKFSQLVPEARNNFVQKLIAEARPTVEPRIQALGAKVRVSLGLPAAGNAGSAPAQSSAPAKKPATK